MYLFKSLVRTIESSHQNLFYPYRLIISILCVNQGCTQKQLGSFFNSDDGYDLLIIMVLLSSLLSNHALWAATDCTTQNDIPATECQTLVNLYKSTQGAHWFDSPANQWNMNQTPCQWQGVVCLQGHVNIINRSQRNLTGPLPELKALNKLQRLNLSDNQLTGTVPTLTALIHLKELYLNNNQFSGTLPTLTTLTQLQWFDVSNNQFSGTLPDLRALTQLQLLNCANNQLTGLIPEWAELKALRVLSLADNQFHGPLPAWDNLVQLQELRLSFNQLTGTVPKLDALVSLHYLYLDHNQLSGSLPSLAHLTQLKVLQLNHNQLEGGVPALPSALQALWLDHNQFQGNLPQLNYLTQLQQLHLDHNAFTGALPPLTALKSLQVLSINHNQLTGSIPQLTGLNQLTQLHLSHNQFSGSLPEFNTLTRLEEIRLDHNQLSGPIPPLNALNHLQELGLANNLLSGDIPQSLSQLPQLVELNLDYNKLTANDPQLIQFLDNKAGYWHTTQTIPPTDLKASQTSENSIQLHWRPIPYHRGEGYYQIHYATEAGGPYQTVSTTDKLIDNYTFTDLRAHSTYFFMIKTHSFIADKQLISAPSTEFSTATTTPSPLALHSRPPINTPLNLGRTQLNKAVTTTLVIINPGQHPITLSQAQITGSHAAEFTLTQAISPLTLAPQTQLSQSLQCRPQAVGVRQATLTLFTDNPQQPTLTYPLTCTGVASAETAQISGEIKTQVGAQGEHLYIDAPERITLTGTIQPLTVHLGQRADILVTYEWLPTDSDTPIVLPLRIAEQVMLEQTMAFILLEHNVLLHLAGTFKVNLGYQLAEQHYTADIITLQVRPNRPPVNLRLEGQRIKENSPVGTLIGSLVTVDHDQGDWFTYGIVDPKSQKYFTIVDNQLQVADQLSLDFETEATHVITVRSTDASGALIEKDFTLEILDEQAVLEDIALTQYQLPENSPEGFIIGKLLTQTTEAGSYHYQLLDDAGGRFNLVNDLLVVAADAQLDYETQVEHRITLRSQDIKTQAVIDKTLTLELVNLIDVALQGAVSNAEGHSIEPPSLNHRERATVTLHIFPDSEHYGQPAELLSVALYHQNDTTIAAYQLDDQQQWQLWDGNLATLTAMQQVHLAKQHEINLLQGQLAGFSGGELNIYGGYRLLNSGEIVYSLTSFDIGIQ